MLASLNDRKSLQPRPIDTNGTSIWRFLQLADSAFPTGGFAHSNGLEAAWQQGAIGSRSDLSTLIRASLWQSTQTVAPFANTTHESPERIHELDHQCDLFTSNHVANRASRVQGKSFISACVNIYGIDLLERQSASFRYGHFAPWAGIALRAVGLSRVGMLQLLAFWQLRALIGSSVRLGIVGPTEAQRIQLEFESDLDPAVAHGEILTLSDLAQTSPLLDLWQGNHDRLYSRLFQS